MFTFRVRFTIVSLFITDRLIKYTNNIRTAPSTIKTRVFIVAIPNIATVSILGWLFCHKRLSGTKLSLVYVFKYTKQKNTINWYTKLIVMYIVFFIVIASFLEMESLVLLAIPCSNLNFIGFTTKYNSSKLTFIY